MQSNLDSNPNCLFQYFPFFQSSKSDPKLLKRILAQSKTTKADADKKDTASAAENRYKVVAALRGLPCESGDADGAVQDESSSAKKESDRLFKLVDVVKEESKKDASDPTKGDGSKKVVQADQIVCNGVPLVKLDEEEYVYDVYTMENSAFSSTDSDRSLMADDFDAMDIMDVRLLDCRDLEHDNDEVWNQARFNTGEDSDSNDEDNWRNDYPDELSEDGEENDYYYREEDLDLDFNKFHLRHGNREIGSSPETSDEDEEGLVYSRDANFDRDADLHGSSYAKYKRKILRDMGEDPEEHEIEGFDDDEDDINQVDEY